MIRAHETDGTLVTLGGDDGLIGILSLEKNEIRYFFIAVHLDFNENFKCCNGIKSRLK